MKDIMHIWLEERDQAIKTMDVKKFKKFYYKWKRRGVYEFDLPDDYTIAISLRKMILVIKSATEEEKEDAKQWLLNRGYSDEI